jgi:hypothetical protein
MLESIYFQEIENIYVVSYTEHTVVYSKLKNKKVQ